MLCQTHENSCVQSKEWFWFEADWLKREHLPCDWFLDRASLQVVGFSSAEREGDRFSLVLNVAFGVVGTCDLQGKKLKHSFV